METSSALRGRAGWRIVAAKELADHLLSLRFTILALLIGAAAILSVSAAAGGIRDAAEAVAEPSSQVPALFLKLFTVAPERIPPFFFMVALLAPLLGIAFGFDAVNGERAQGTLPRLLSQPVYRDDVINGKFVAGLSVISLVLGVLTLIVAGVGMLRIGVVPSGAQVARLTLFLLLTIIYAGFWLALASLFSVVLRGAATSAIAAIGSWLLATLFAELLVGILANVFAPVPPQASPLEEIRNARVEQNLARVFPGTLYGEATVVLLTPEQRSLDPLLGSPLLYQLQPGAIPSELRLDQSLLIVWPQVTGLIALTVLCFAAAYLSFMRQEIRA
jgi:ABC-2 type transport system permease protein